MKNILKILFIYLISANFCYSETSLKIEPIVRQNCVVVSCCGIGLLSYEVYSVRYCFFMGNKTATLTFDNSTNNKELNFVNDQILPGLTNDKGEQVIIKAGKYILTDNVLTFEPSFIAARPWCISFTKTIFGNTGSTTTGCWDWIWNKNSQDGFGNLTLTPKLDIKQQSQLNENGSLEIICTEDYLFKDEKVNYLFKAGKYVVNANGNIYLQNIKIK